jgi:hypothetical protein
LLWITGDVLLRTYGYVFLLIYGYIVQRTDG